MKKTRFEWDEKKDAENQNKHGISFFLAQYAFADPCRVIAKTWLTVEEKNDISVSVRSMAVSSPFGLPIVAK